MAHSCRKHLVDFLDQFWKWFAKDLMGLSQPAMLAEGGVIKIVRDDLQAGGDVFADEIKPGLLFRIEFGHGNILGCPVYTNDR